jgi:antitoxin (DNA-binding transcriptional repressor) of toxin-antitoxin stability system
VKTLAIEKTNLASCVSAAKSGRVLVTKKGKPVALLVNVNGLDAEQIELGTSDKFWKLITTRRQEKTISRAELEARMSDPIARKAKPRR